MEEDDPPGTKYTNSENGSFDTELWFKDHFLKHAVSSRPLLLRDKTHYQPKDVQYYCIWEYSATLVTWQQPMICSRVWDNVLLYDYYTMHKQWLYICAFNLTRK